jgi:hypothetical protein
MHQALEAVAAIQNRLGELLPNIPSGSISRSVSRPPENDVSLTFHSCFLYDISLFIAAL